MTTPSLSTTPPVVETIDPVARSCVDAWQAFAGIGGMLASGRLVDAWNAATGALDSCWASLIALVTSALPFLA